MLGYIPFLRPSFIHFLVHLGSYQEISAASRVNYGKFPVFGPTLNVDWGWWGVPLIALNQVHFSIEPGFFCIIPQKNPFNNYI